MIAEAEGPRREGLVRQGRVFADLMLLVAASAWELHAPAGGGWGAVGLDVLVLLRLMRSAWRAEQSYYYLAAGLQALRLAVAVDGAWYLSETENLSHIVWTKLIILCILIAGFAMSARLRVVRARLAFDYTPQ